MVYLIKANKKLYSQVSGNFSFIRDDTGISDAYFLLSIKLIFLQSDTLCALSRGTAAHKGAVTGDKKKTKAGADLLFIIILSIEKSSLVSPLVTRGRRALSRSNRLLKPLFNYNNPFRALRRARRNTNTISFVHFSDGLWNNLRQISLRPLCRINYLSARAMHATNQNFGGEENVKVRRQALTFLGALASSAMMCCFCEQSAWYQSLLALQDFARLGNCQHYCLEPCAQG
jgi:hypothetical protein